MYDMTKKLIEKQFYKNAEEASERVNVFFAHALMNGEQYDELTELVVSVYGSPAPVSV